MQSNPPDEIQGEIVPVFPLPNVVFFPQTVLPLHIFEARYRQMVRDAVEGNRLIAIALLKGDWKQDYDGAPDLYDIGTVGRIEDLVSLPDGRFDLKLTGLRRVKMSELPTDKMYRMVQTEPRIEAEIPEAGKLERAKMDLLASHSYLLREISDRQDGSLAFDSGIPFRDAVNRVCANLPVEPVGRQQLLEIDCLRERQRSAHQIVTELLQRVLLLKGDPGDDSEQTVN